MMEIIERYERQALACERLADRSQINIDMLP